MPRPDAPPRLDIVEKARASQGYLCNIFYCNDLVNHIDKLTAALEQVQVRREELAEGREHLTVTNEFQSDKYPWCAAGFVPLKVTDPMATTLLWAYAGRRRVVDKEFTRDVEEALLFARDKSG